MPCTIFVINLAHEAKKKALMEEIGQQHQLEFTFMEAVYGDGLDDGYIDSIVDRETTYARIGRYRLTKGEIGCLLSHRAIYKKIMDENLPYALILEDDIHLSPDFTSILEIAPLEKDLILWGCHADGSNMRLRPVVSSFWHRTKLKNKYYLAKPIELCLGAYGYSISYKKACELYQATEVITGPVDEYTGDINMKNSYVCHPPLVLVNRELLAESTIEKERQVLHDEKRQRQAAESSSMNHSVHLKLLIRLGLDLHYKRCRNLLSRWRKQLFTY